MQNIKAFSQKQKVNIFEAQGELNRQIQTALQSFRQKLTGSVDTYTKKHDVYEDYSIKKHGPQKVFLFKQSLLSIMLEIKDFKTLHNMVIASFIILTFTLIYSNYYEHGQFLDHSQLSRMFAGYRFVIIYWFILVLIHFTIILVTKISLKSSKIIWIPLYLLHQTILLGTAMHISKSQQLGFACIVIIMAQGTRMLMKSHSYFRTKMLYLTDNQYKSYSLKGIKAITSKEPTVQKIQKAENNSQRIKQIKIQISDNDLFTQIKNLSYFFVAPTIIYRDHYILTPIRSMSRIIANFLNFLACVYYTFMLYVFLCKKPIEDLYQKLDFSTILITVIKLMLPSVFFLLLGFFGFLHCWLNCWAQITRFPDRCFYSDWWNSIQFGSYYRKWNIIVHDWLYYFIYIDCCRFAVGKKIPKYMPKLLTFLISAIIHELIITYAIGFFYPILFILFTGPGILLIQNQRHLKSISVNLAFWLEMYIGSSLLFTFYLIEAFARKRITDQFIYGEWGTIIGVFIPRTIYLGPPMQI